MTPPSLRRRSRHRPTGSCALVLGSVAMLAAVAPAARGDDWTSLGLDQQRSRVSAELSAAGFGAASWSHAWTESERPSYRAVLATPAVGDGFVAFATQRNAVEVLREADGVRLWQARAGGMAIGSPAMWRGRIYVAGADQKLVAFDVTSGAQLWSHDLGGVAQGSPIVVDGRLYLTTGIPTPRLLCLDAATGAVIWQTDAGIFTTAALASVAVTDGRVIAAELEGRVFSFAAANGQLQWMAATGGRVALSSPLLSKGRVYLLPGGREAKLFAFDLATGVAPEGWPVVLPVPTPDTGLGALRERRFVASSLAGPVQALVFSLRIDDRLGSSATGEPATFVAQEILFGVDGVSGEVRFSTPNGRLVTDNPNHVPHHELLPTPALYRDGEDGLLVAAASSVAARLRVLDLAGDERWSVALSAPTRSSPVFANGRLLIATDAGVVHSFLSSGNQPPVAPALGFFPAGGALVTTATVDLRWGAAADVNGHLATYEVRIDDDGEILRDWDLAVTTGAGIQSASVAGLVAHRLYTYAVRARDPNGAQSPWSHLETFRTAVPVDVAVDGEKVGSLTQALAAARPGATIQLGSGVMQLSETLRLPAGVALAGAGPHLTTLAGDGLGTAVALGAGADLRQLTVRGAEIGVAVDAAPEARLRNVIVRDNKVAGVAVGPAGRAEIVNATIARNGAGVKATGATSTRNSLVTGNQLGFVTTDPGLLATRYNDVFGNMTADYEGGSPHATDLSVAVTFLPDAPDHFLLQRAQGSTDRGDPADPYDQEPAPNGGRVNVGAFGNTPFAELSAELPAPSSPDAGMAPADAASADTASPSTPDAHVPISSPDAAPVASVGLDSGCSCRVGARQGAGAALPLLAVLLAALVRMRRRRS